jgi:hypothetical protein
MYEVADASTRLEVRSTLGRTFLNPSSSCIGNVALKKECTA